MTRNTIRLAAALAVILVATVTLADTFKIVVHPSTDVSSLTKTQLSDYLLKRKVTWPNGMPVIPVDQPDKSAVRAMVLRDVFGRSENAIRSYWNQQIFSGRAIPPVQKESDAEVVAFVKISPGAIGYVSTSARVGKLTVVAIR